MARNSFLMTGEQITTYYQASESEQSIDKEITSAQAQIYDAISVKTPHK